jgi:hypothetical protein
MKTSGWRISAPILSLPGRIESPALIPAECGKNGTPGGFAQGWMGVEGGPGAGLAAGPTSEKMPHGLFRADIAAAGKL